MKIHKPFNGFVADDYPRGSVTQWFGENVDLYKVVPGLSKGHNGIDIVAPWGTKLFAVEDGIVVDVKDDAGGYGKHIRLVTDVPGVNREWTYGHLSFIHVKVGDRVAAGAPIGAYEPQMIAQMGNTGFVVSSSNGGGFWHFNPYEGTHLHLGLRLFNYTPTGWCYHPGQRFMTTLNYDNGWCGGVDFRDMLPLGLDGLKEDLDKQGYAETWQKVVFVLKWLGFK